jgi:hypothetical protein
MTKVPKQTIWTGNECAGVDIHFVKSTQTLRIGGHYDRFVGIESEAISLRDFFQRLGINKSMCLAAFKELK